MAVCAGNAGVIGRLLVARKASLGVDGRRNVFLWAVKTGWHGGVHRPIDKIDDFIGIRLAWRSRHEECCVGSTVPQQLASLNSVPEAVESVDLNT